MYFSLSLFSSPLFLLLSSWLHQLLAAIIPLMLNRRTADEDIESYKRTNVQAPQVCVDYLSYVFDELDLAASWRVMTKQKNDEMTGIRLENASWRTWAKQRGRLETVSPETLDW